MKTTSYVNFGDLLLRPKRPRIQSDYFPYFILDDYVSAPLYQRLLEEFPPPEEMLSNYQHGKRMINNRQLAEHDQEEAFFRNRPAWRQITEILGSQAFVDDLESLLRPHILRHRLFGAFRKWRADGARMPPFDRSVQLTYEWSSMPPGSYINPHTDKAAKLATFVWHFPEAGWRHEDCGATVFMVAKRWKHNFNWANFKLPFRELNVLETSEVEGNRLVMFAKTGNSWHAVPPIECGPNTGRRVFIFNYRYPVDIAGSLPVRAMESFHRRSQGWLFKDFPDVNRKPGA